MRRPRALDNELYGHRRHAPLAAGGVRERMGRNARAIQEIKARLNLVDISDILRLLKAVINIVPTVSFLR